MTTQALAIQDLQSKMTQLQLAYTAVNVANQQAGLLVAQTTVSQVQTDITTLNNAVNALVPAFAGNN